MSKLACALTVAVGLTFFGTGTSEAEAGAPSFYFQTMGPRTPAGYSGGYRINSGYRLGPSYGYYRRPAVSYSRSFFAPSYGQRQIHHHHYHGRPACDRGYYGY